jgi:hypothetical protein
MPCELHPRNWMVAPQEFTSWFPLTLNFPLMETGEAAEGIELRDSKKAIPRTEENFRAEMKYVLME